MRQYPTDQDVYQRTQDEYIMFLQSRHIEAISALENVKKVWPIVAQRPGTPIDSKLPQGLIDLQLGQAEEILFPNPDTGHGERPYNDTWDNFGPIYVPKAGKSVELTPEELEQLTDALLVSMKATI